MVDFWKEQARPEYDESFLLTPPSEDDADDKRPPRDGLHHRRWHQIEMVRGRRCHFFSSESGLACGAMTGRLAPVPGSPWNVGDCDGVEPMQAPEGGHRRAQV